MNNGFGFKDAAMLVLLICVLVSVWLGMWQVDRNWKRLREIETTLANQFKEIQSVKQRVASGVVSPGEGAGGASGSSGVVVDEDLFPRIQAAHEKPDFAFGDWYVWPIASRIKRLTPLVAGDIYQNYVAGFVLQTLAEFDADTMQWNPTVARSWEISEDGLTITFKLRKGIRFSGGEPLTAQDVAFTFNWIMNPKVNAPRSRAYYEKIRDVTAVDDYTVVFEFKEPYFLAFVFAAGMEILCEEYYSQFTEEQFNQMPGLLYGSGPYRLDVDPEAWKPLSGAIRLVRNERYWAPKPGFDQIIFREMEDETARKTAFINGEVDVFPAVPHQYREMKDDPQVREQANLHVYDAIDGGYLYVGWNQMRDGEPTRFADQRVRQAMAYLVDREAITERIMLGLATVADGPFHPLGEQDDPDIEPRQYNREKGLSLLAEAGYEDRDGDGVVEGPDGEPFRFELTYPAGSTTFEGGVLYMKDDYARSGIILDLNPLEWTILQQRLDDRNFDAISLGWGAGWIESDPYQMFHSSQIEDGGDNYVHYDSERFDALVEQARVTVDDQQRRELWHKVHRTLYEEQPYMFLFNRKSIIFIDKRIKNVRITPRGMLYTIPEYYVPEPLQKRGK